MEKYLKKTKGINVEKYKMVKMTPPRDTVWLTKTRVFPDRAAAMTKQ